MIIDIDESQRQHLIMALAHLAVERPGWNHMLSITAGLMDNENLGMYTELKTLHSGNIDIMDQYFGEGIKARHAEQALSTNPYTIGISNSQRWEAGWRYRNGLQTTQRA